MVKYVVMNAQKTSRVISTFLCLAIAIGIISTIIQLRISGISAGITGLIGLFVGSLAVISNYLLLQLMIKTLTSSSPFMAVQIYVLRLLIYLVGGFLAVKLGIEGIITFSASIVGISVAVFIVYAIGGIRETK